MRYIAAYLLAVLGGNNSPKAADIVSEKENTSTKTQREKKKAKKQKIIFFSSLFPLSLSLLQTKILSSVGIEADASRIEKLLKELEGKELEAVIKEGTAKFAALPTGGGGGAPAAAPAAAAGGAAKKEAPKEEVKEEEEAAVSFDLFD